MSSDNMRCPRCGKEVSASDKFCPFCGQDLQQGTRGRRGRGIVKIVLALAIIAVVGIVVYGNIRYSKSAQLDRIENAVRSSNDDQLEDVLVNQHGHEVDDEYLDAFIALLDTHSGNREEIIKQIEAGNGEAVRLVKQGRVALFFPEYKLELKDRKVTVTGATDQTHYYLDDDLVTTGKQLRLPAGSYQLRIGDSSAANNDDARYRVIVLAKGMSLLALPAARSTDTAAASSTGTGSGATATTAAAIITKYKPSVTARNTATDFTAVTGEWDYNEDNLELKPSERYELDREGRADEAGSFKLVYHKGSVYNLQFNPRFGKSYVHSFVLVENHLVNAQTKQLWTRDRDD
ncbi:zinc ribbon domain-containing protein [Lacticaseibacillus pabuli]|uniref:Zinc ribbon domain-containing protein n=1 Tax=Lacticaseibacillus pabuli TaxID=3025672 RepID=A0ABY7WSV2_9LACO|nr:zinc-ribbon domain-containing protein [Lacticaseibacillus sp. KACC 23028]WDF82104.1 zinc ribbon domain-containing protein [Lacticaseibacillus sp. KACC 23028]